ncbi:MAG: tetratricopeptide repeat protein, partial [Bacteroidia bacterium]
YAAADSVADMYYLRGFYAFAKNDTATAMKQLKQAFKMLKSYPNAEVPYQMGTMFLLQKNYSSAHQYIELSIRMDSSSAIYPFANGYVYQQEKKYEEAIQWYLQAIRKNNNLAKPYLQLYEIYANELKDKQKALSINEKLLTINPKHPLANYHKANDVYQKGMENTDEKVMKENLAGAAVLYSIAIQADEKFVNAYYARGLSYFFMDAEEEAVKDFEKTLQLNPQHANAHFQLGSIFEHHQDLITALQHYEAAAAIQPDFKEALQAVKELKAKVGN